MTTFSAALARKEYELAALRLLLGVLDTIEEAAPATRDELIALLTVERR
ncbi:MAG: hypothetical protein K1X87_04415 [Dehalococcoidia bacterium]|nr:hypothetical protein [Dehalococcoidia bacterium]